MSVFGFYVEVNAGCIVILLLLLYSIKRLPTPQVKYELFQTLVIWHIVYFISDSFWALVNDATFPKNTFTVLAVKYFNAIIMPFVAYNCFMFSEISTRPEMTHKQINRLQFKLRIPIIVQAVALLVSFWLAPDFWLDDQLEPVDFYYFILSFLPLIYWIAGTIRGLLRTRTMLNRANLGT